jgi:hypothetical protein
MYREGGIGLLLNTIHTPQVPLIWVNGLFLKQSTPRVEVLVRSPVKGFFFAAVAPLFSFTLLMVVAISERHGKS